MKKFIQALLRACGYRIEKIREKPPGDLIFLLDLALFILNQRRGGDVRFLQIGANDGLQEDPCHAWLQRFAWRGVLVEPQPNLAAGLQRMYADHPRISVDASAIADRAGDLTLYYLEQGPGIPAWSTGVASLKYEALAGHRAKIPGFDAAVRQISVPTKTVDQVLQEHGLSEIDFLQVDAEGYDAQILRSFDFRRHRPAVVMYEDCNLSHEDRVACRALLAGHGYAFATWHGDTLACLPEVLPVSPDRLKYFDFDPLNIAPAPGVSRTALG